MAHETFTRLSAPSAAKRIGLVWVHGVFGSPREYGQVIPHFQQQGYQCLALTLPGHGPNPAQRFEQLQPEDFIQHVHSSVLSFQQAQALDQLVLIGHSLGAILSLSVAGSLSGAGLRGIVALGGAYEDAALLNARQWFRLPLRQLVLSLPYVKDYWHGFERPELPLRSYPLFRTRGYSLLRELQTNLPTVQQPVLLAHSPYDLSIPYFEMHKLYQVLKAAGTPVATVTLENCGHQIFPLSAAQPETIALIERFVRYVTQRQTPRLSSPQLSEALQR